VAAADTACVRSVGSRASAIMFMLTSAPVSGSRAAGWPFLTMNGETPNAAAVTYFRLAAIRGRR